MPNATGEQSITDRIREVFVERLESDDSFEGSVRDRLVDLLADGIPSDADSVISAVVGPMTEVEDEAS